MNFRFFIVTVLSFCLLTSCGFMAKQEMNDAQIAYENCLKTHRTKTSYCEPERVAYENSKSKWQSIGGGGLLNMGGGAPSNTSSRYDDSQVQTNFQLQQIQMQQQQIWQQQVIANDGLRR